MPARVMLSSVTKDDLSLGDISKLQDRGLLFLSKKSTRLTRR